jgi:hypothetical protein
MSIAASSTSRSSVTFAAIALITCSAPIALADSSSTLTQRAILIAPDETSENRFGLQVALSANGTTALVGARRQEGTGAAYVFRRIGQNWVFAQKLLPAGLLPDDFFGAAVALSADGNIALVGAPAFFADCATRPTCNGAAYIFKRAGSTWTQVQRLVASDATDLDRFGFSVALSASGKTALIGAQSAACEFEFACGAGYVFEREDGLWDEDAKLTQTTPDPFTVQIGTAAALSAAGTTAFLGANDAVYVFRRQGGDWREQQVLIATDGSDAFGRSIALSANGRRAVIGALSAAFAFVRRGNTWTQELRFPLEGIGATDVPVALSATGHTALFGVSVPEICAGTSGNCGAVLFRRERGEWVEHQRLSGSDTSSSRSFGDWVALSAFGGVALIGGAFRECIVPPVTCTGAAYVFD